MPRSTRRASRPLSRGVPCRPPLAASCAAELRPMVAMLMASRRPKSGERQHSRRIRSCEAIAHAHAFFACVRVRARSRAFSEGGVHMSSRPGLLLGVLHVLRGRNSRTRATVPTHPDKPTVCSPLRTSHATTPNRTSPFHSASRPPTLSRLHSHTHLHSSPQPTR